MTKSSEILPDQLETSLHIHFKRSQLPYQINWKICYAQNANVL